MKQLINELKQKGIPFVVLRDNQCGTDWDVMIRKCDVKKIVSIAFSQGFNLSRKGFTTKHLGLNKIVEGKKIGLDLQIDGVYWNDMKYLCFKYPFEDEDYFLMYLCHSILGKRRFKAEYKKILSQYYTELDWEYVHWSLVDIWDHKNAEFLIEMVKRRDFKAIENRAYWLCFKFIISRWSNIINFSKTSMRWLLWKCQ